MIAVGGSRSSSSVSAISAPLVASQRPRKSCSSRAGSIDAAWSAAR